MKFTQFGEKFTRYSGITQLMDDLNDGLRTPGAIMLGGGNPAGIPAMLDYFKDASQKCSTLVSSLRQWPTTMVLKVKTAL